MYFVPTPIDKHARKRTFGEALDLRKDTFYCMSDVPDEAMDERSARRGVRIASPAPH